ADRASAINQKSLAENLALLTHVMSAKLVSEENRVFRTYRLWRGSESLDLYDIDPKGLDVLLAAVPHFRNVHILARLNDLIWIRKRPKELAFARSAITSHIAIASRCRANREHLFVEAKASLRRALSLALSVNAMGDLLLPLLEELELWIDHQNAEPDGYIRYFFFELAIDGVDETNFDHWNTSGEDFVRQSCRQENYRKARDYTSALERLARRFKRVELADQRRDEIAALFVSEVRHLREKGAAPLILQSHYTAAIEACRRRPNKRGIAAELLGELLEVQKDVQDDFKRFSQEVNLVEPIESLLERMKSLTTSEALTLIALKAMPRPKAELIRMAEEQAKRYPIQFLFKKTVVDELGKVVQQRAGLYGDLVERRAALVQHAAEFYSHQALVMGSIIPFAQRELYERAHDVDIAIREILVANPFVPETRFYQFMTGLQAGMRGDYVAASAILIPQFENSFRSLLQGLGVNLVTINNQGVQSEKDLNTFLFSEEFKDNFGEDLQFQLQALFTKVGTNIRNDFAHGLLTDGMAFSHYGPYIWALTIFLCIRTKELYVFVGPKASESET
ncbi:MAG: DUF4209 domain-containing protein, partial [Proteobacteria bacterium]